MGRTNTYRLLRGMGSADGGLDFPTPKEYYTPKKEMGRQCAARSYMICEARKDSAPKNNYGGEREWGRRRRNGDLRKTKRKLNSRKSKEPSARRARLSLLSGAESLGPKNYTLKRERAVGERGPGLPDT